ncbi:MAG: hypothetical protein H7068_03620 [Pedobacter sp.]|nr:hypothetical protein [Chitinophagaceae bacterium]
MTVNGNVISVKNWGEKFDGDYDIIKLAKDSCVTGDCMDGNGRKVLAKIVNGNPRIRIMEGKFKFGTYLGSGVMLIDGEGKVLDGMYKIEKFKANYYTNQPAAKTVFHSKFTNEDVMGNYSGYGDWGFRSAQDETYQTFVVNDFKPDYHDKKENFKMTVWEKDIFWPIYIKWSNEYTSSPKFLATRAKSRRENGLPPENSPYDLFKTYMFQTNCSYNGQSFEVISRIAANIAITPFEEIKNEAIRVMQRKNWSVNSNTEYLGEEDKVILKGKPGKDYVVSDGNFYTVKKN